jgi:hypothetical protein
VLYYIINAVSEEGDIHMKRLLVFLAVSVCSIYASYDGGLKVVDSTIMKNVSSV